MEKKESAPVDMFAEYGNFQNYYEFNPVCDRMMVIRECAKLHEILSQNQKPINHFDVGCNAGDLTVAFHSFLSEFGTRVQSEGVDCDRGLIDKAYSRASIDGIKFVCGNIMDGCRPTHQDHVFGITTCFSVTMWVHLHHGDEGLLRFLNEVSRSTDVLIVEPQHWKSYLSANRRRRKSGQGNYPLFKNLQIRRKDVVTAILNCGMKLLEEGVTRAWNRNIFIFVKQ